MGNLGGGELLIILLLGLVVLGPSRLVVVARQFGRVAREVRRRPGERALREKQRAMEKHLAEGRRALSLADEQVSRAWSCLSPLSPK